ncbi:hypothetical protein G4B88_021845 [Cannabis sativa]|uniref:HMA domain-containing protein n=1 Tax=Cannabis sativa TaxID=3483 RepID=A0A7J6H190_CANSA|nr:hypothetical protein G4B88_021845 [Cannabis sativa]
MEKCEIRVKGCFDPIKVQKRIQKLSKKKIELISPKVQIKETTIIEKKVTKEIKQVRIHSVKADMKTQILVVDGSIEGEKLVSFLRRKVHKHAEIIISGNKEEKKVETIKQEKEEIITSIDSGSKVEIKEQVKVVEAKSKEGNAPYFIHYVYAPQLFSDENPNACTIS